MRAKLLVVGALASLCFFSVWSSVVGQEPAPDKAQKQKNSGPPDEQREIFKQIVEAYKAPHEVHEDVLEQLRKQYQDPTPQRENKIFRELRRLYDMTDEQEAAILREVRAAYQRQSPDQEMRLFQTIAMAERLPEGTVPASVQVEQAKKIFRRLDQNGDGLLSPSEMPEGLRTELSRWDSNKDHFIEMAEYWGFYQAQLQDLSDRVASGEIELKIKKGGQPLFQQQPQEQETRPVVFRAGNLPKNTPDWFIRLDTDNDAQLGLYEWKASGRSIEEFQKMDRNGDGFITIEELMHYLSQQEKSDQESASGNS